MTKLVRVQRSVYESLRAAMPGEAIVAQVHLHARLNGPCEIQHSCLKPIKCRIVAEESRGERRKLKSKSVRVVLTKE